MSTSLCQPKSPGEIEPNAQHTLSRHRSPAWTRTCPCSCSSVHRHALPRSAVPSPLACRKPFLRLSNACLTDPLRLKERAIRTRAVLTVSSKLKSSLAVPGTRQLLQALFKMETRVRAYTHCQLERQLLKMKMGRGCQMYLSMSADMGTRTMKRGKDRSRSLFRAFWDKTRNGCRLHPPIPREATFRSGRHQGRLRSSRNRNRRVNQQGVASLRCLSRLGRNMRVPCRLYPNEKTCSHRPAQLVRCKIESLRRRLHLAMVDPAN